MQGKTVGNATLPSEQGGYLDGKGAGGLLKSLEWKLNRLRCMSPAEIAHRCLRALSMRTEQRAPVAAVPQANLERMPEPWLAFVPRVEASHYIEAAQRARQGRFDVFAMKNVELGTPPRWNRDPRTGIEPPLSFGKRLDYRDERIAGDCKYLWEPNRHLHFVTLAQAYALTGDSSHLEALRSHLESWLDAAPYPLGVHWSSSLESGLRLLNWSLAWQLVGGARSVMFENSAGRRLRERWLESIYRHAEFVSGHYSLYSSANNHLLGEACGVFVAAITWPTWDRAAQWESASRAIIEREAMLQNAPDGVNREQAISYQQFTFDLLLFPLLYARAARRPLSGAVSARMEAMLEFVASVMDVGGGLPMYGDADDAFAARLSNEPGFCRFRSQLATGAVLFKRPEFKAKARVLDDKTRWLLGPGAESIWNGLRTDLVRLPIRRAFPDGGYYVMGWNFEAADEVKLVADAGPLGYGGIAAHGHADALSFTLTLGGRDFLVDPGTYAYHTQEAWRSYFRGTAAHNTVRVDGEDQSVPGGKFMWLKKHTGRCTLWSVSRDRDELEGWHDGYQRLADPVVHRRHIACDKPGRRILVEDRLEMAGEHDVELFFHFAEHCDVTTEGNSVRVTSGDRSMLLSLPAIAGGRVSLLRGSHAPIGGWISRAFDKKVPAWTVVWKARLQGAQQLSTQIRVI